MKLKKILSSILCVAMILSTMGTVAFAQEPALPNAEVLELGEITIDEYSVWSGNLKEGEGSIGLQVAMEFIAKDTAEEAAANHYGNYTTDFFITMTGMAGESFFADGCYLAGNYGEFGWIQIPLDGFEVKNGVTYPVITSVDFDFKYTDICSTVQDFKCGIYLSDKVIDENPDLEVNLALGLSETLEAAQAANFTTVDAYTYPVSHFGAVAEVNGTPYFDLGEAVSAANDKDTIILYPGEHELPLFSGKELTFKGRCKQTVIVNDAPSATQQGWLGSTFHFENLTAKGATSNYYGLANGVVAVTYKDCIVKELRFLFAKDIVSFDNCVFETTGKTEHSFWTYGANKVTVKDSTFNYVDRAVNCYDENEAHTTDIEFTNCVFNYTGNKENPDGAVEINSGDNKPNDGIEAIITINLTMNGCTAPEKGAMWYNSPWDGENGKYTSVKIDDKYVWPEIRVGNVGYTTIDEAVNAAKDGDTIEILGAEDGEVSEIKVNNNEYELGETEVITTDIDEGIEVTVPELVSVALGKYDGTQATYAVVVDHDSTSYEEDIATLNMDISLKRTYDGITENVDIPNGQKFTVKVKLPADADLSVIPTVLHDGTPISDVKVIDGYVVFETDGFSPYTLSYQLKAVSAPTEMCEAAVVSFEEVEPGENSTVYDIVINSTDNKDIFGLVSAQMDIDEAADMSGVNFLVEGANDFVVTNDEDSYLFTLKAADNPAVAAAKSGESVKIGKLTISGFTTEAYTVNAIIEADDGAATSYLDTSVTPAESKNIHIALDGGSVQYTKAVPTQELTVEVTFPKTISDNNAAYQDMTVTITEQDLGTVETFKLGEGGVELNDGKYTMSKDLQKYKTYTVKIEGAGYRTFTKSLYLDADKTMIVWNNYVENGALIVKNGESDPEAKASITFLAGDIVKDNTVNAYDLSVLLSYAFTDGINTDAASKYTQYDLNRDGLINYKDAAMILDVDVWGK